MVFRYIALVYVSKIVVVLCIVFYRDRSEILMHRRLLRVKISDVGNNEIQDECELESCMSLCNRILPDRDPSRTLFLGNLGDSIKQTSSTRFTIAKERDKFQVDGSVKTVI